MGFDATLFLGIEIREFTMQIFSKTDLLVDFQSSITESFSYVKYGWSIITSKILSKILSNENQKTGVSRNIVCFGILIHALS